MTIELAPDAQPTGTKMPESWINNGDGRGRGGRERVWIVADVVLAIKVSFCSSSESPSVEGSKLTIPREGYGFVSSNDQSLAKTILPSIGKNPAVSAQRTQEIHRFFAVELS